MLSTKQRQVKTKNAIIPALCPLVVFFGTITNFSNIIISSKQSLVILIIYAFFPLYNFFFIM